MQREKRKLNVKQKRREEKIENEISIVYLAMNTDLYKLKRELSISLYQLKTEHGRSNSLAYTSNERHSCLKPPSTSWKTPA